MPHRPDNTLIYHITDVVNLPAILAAGGLHSDAVMARRTPAVVIGYDHIKLRRLREIRVPCCGDRFVGEFVPFYYCPRSPMLYTINRGATGRPAGCQRTIIHLVSRVADGLALDRPWAISDGNAGAFHASFYADADALERELNWAAIEARQWQGMTHQKAAEFLVADFFPFERIHLIGCHNQPVANRVRDMLNDQPHRPAVRVETGWYY